MIVKPIKNSNFNNISRILGCTNYKQDGTGCNFSMFGYNFTQDKSKILIMNNGKVLRSNIKSEVNKMLQGIADIYNKNSNFRFSYKSLINFLKGEEDKTILSFKLNQNFYYGMFKDKESYYVPKVISILLDLNILVRVKNEKGYENIDLCQNILSDNQALIIEQQFY